MPSARTRARAAGSTGRSARSTSTAATRTATSTRCPVTTSSAARTGDQRDRHRRAARLPVLVRAHRQRPDHADDERRVPHRSDPHDRRARTSTDNSFWWKWPATLRQARESTDADVHRHPRVRVDERLLQPHERLLLDELPQREDRRELPVDGPHVGLAAAAGRRGRRRRRARHVQPPRQQPQAEPLRRRLPHSRAPRREHDPRQLERGRLRAGGRSTASSAWRSTAARTSSGSSRRCATAGTSAPSPPRTTTSARGRARPCTRR